MFRAPLLLLVLGLAPLLEAGPISPSAFAQSRCEALVTASPTDEADPASSSMEKRAHAAAAEALLYMTLQHPSIKEATSVHMRKKTKQIRTLFHLSMGMADPPPRPRFVFSPDPTGYFKLFSIPSKRSDNLGLSIQQARASFSSLSLHARQELALEVVTVASQVWNVLADSKTTSTSDSEFSISADGYMYRGEINRTPPNRNRIKIRNFTALNQAQFTRFQKLARLIQPKRENAESNLIRALLVDFLTENLGQILQLREQLFTNQHSLANFIYSRFTKGNLDHLLAQKIESLAQGQNFAESIESPKLEKASIEVLQLQMLAADTPKLEALRAGVRALDLLVDEVPAASRVRDLGVHLMGLIELEDQAPELQRRFNQQAEAARLKSNALMSLQQRAEILGGHMTQLQIELNSEMNLGQKNISDRERAALANELLLYHVNLQQTLSLLENRSQIQLQFVELSQQLQALLRQYRLQGKLGEDNRELGRKLIDQLFNLQSAGPE